MQTLGGDWGTDVRAQVLLARLLFSHLRRQVSFPWWQLSGDSNCVTFCDFSILSDTIVPFTDEETEALEANNFSKATWPPWSRVLGW